MDNKPTVPPYISSEDLPPQVRRALDAICDKVKAGAESGDVLDADGVKVGTFDTDGTVVVLR